MLLETNKWAISGIAVAVMALAYIIARQIRTMTPTFMVLFVIGVFFTMYGFLSLDWQCV